LEYVDIYYSHRFDPDSPLDETMSALDTAVRSGKALYAGISSYNSQQTRDAVRVARENSFTPLLIHQPNYSMLNRWIEKRLLPTCGELGLGIIAFCPLYQGLLTDKYLNGIPPGSRATIENSLLTGENLRPEVIAMIRELNEHARQRGQTLAQMALAWVLRDPRVTSALIGASRPEQILDNMRAVQNTNFSNDELAKIDGILGRAAMPPSPWASE
jgi:L-glyceraldehyde 3-phosphate reductase